MTNSQPFLSREVSKLASEIYRDRTPDSALTLAPYLTVLYHDLATGADRERPERRGFNAYMFLALFREMSQGE